MIKEKKNINVVHVIRGSYGGAGIAAIRLNDSLNKHGVMSTVICCDKDNSGEHRIVLGKGNLLLRANRWLATKFTHSRREHTDYPFNSSYCGFNLSESDPIRNADVIHLHWICDALTVREIAKICKLGKAVIWTCHDLWPFTGGCHYHYDDSCPNYTKGCYNCSLLKNGSLIAHKNFEKKRMLLEKQQITFVAPSRWMASMINNSFFNKKDVYVIPNVVDVEIFRPDRTERNKSDNGDVNILFAMASSSITYKGFRYLEDMLDRLLKDKPQLAERLVINILGNHTVTSLVLDKYRQKLWGFVSDEKEMSIIYSSCDLLAYPSYKDNLPSVVMESLLCETPVLAFDTGGIPDMVEHLEGGYIAKYRDTEDFYQGLLWILDNNKDNILGRQGRERALDLCNETRIVDAHVNMYLKSLGI